MIVSWYIEHEGAVVINERRLEMEMPIELHYTLIKKAFKSANLTQEGQEILKAIVFKDFKTDSIIRMRSECDWSIPHPEVKKRIWNIMKTPEIAIKISLYDYQMFCRLFMQPFISYHLGLSIDLAQEFYEIAPVIV